MRTIWAVVAVLAVFSDPLHNAQAAPVFNLNNLPGTAIQFNGAASSFQFNNNSLGDQWRITSQNGGTGTAVGLMGWFTGGPWHYSSVAVSGFNQTALVNTAPAATLTISDGASLGTAHVAWGLLSTFESIGGLNANLAINLSDLSYSGLNPDLLDFFSSPSGLLVVSFQFNPAMTLSQLTAGTEPYITSFSGSLTPVPEPAAGLVLVIGLLASGRRLLGRQ